MNFLYILGGPLGYVMRWIYDLVLSYGWAIILFTLLVRVISFPLQLKQQKSTARMAAYQPMIQEIQKKYANDQQKQQEELMSLQQEYGFSPTAGCLPMMLNFFVLFGVIEAVYRPVQHVLRVSKDAVTAAIELLGLNAANVDSQSALIQTIKSMTTSEAVQKFSGILTETEIAAINNFQTNFLGIDLCATPRFEFTGEAIGLLIFPILSLVTMILLNSITMKMSGQEMKGMMKAMPWLMSLMFVGFCFRVPVAFSLYYTVSNVLMFVQSIVLKKIYDPEEYKQQLAEEIKAKKEAKKKKKEVKVRDEDGNVVVKQMTDSELAKLRLELARREDEEKYKDERTTPLTEAERAALAPPEKGKKTSRKAQKQAEEDSAAAAARALGEDPKEE